MKLEDFITVVQNRADTEGQAIDAADVSRVVSIAFYELKERLMPTAATLGAVRLDELSEVLELICQGYQNRTGK